MLAQATGNQSLSRENARQLQTLLDRLGFGAGQPDGIPGRGTERAINQFSRSTGRRPGSATPSQAYIIIQRELSARELVFAARAMVAGYTPAPLPTQAPVSEQEQQLDAVLKLPDRMARSSRELRAFPYDTWGKTTGVKRGYRW